MDLLEALEIVVNNSQSGSRNKLPLQLALSLLTDAAEEEGLAPDYLQELVALLCSDKINHLLASQILRCIVPITTISKPSLKDLLSWILTHASSSPPLERQCYRWILEIVKNDLGDKTILQRYFVSFLFAAVQKSHLVQTVGCILYYLATPGDVTKFNINVIESLRRKNTAQSLTALLGRFKSLRPDLMKEDISDRVLNPPRSQFTASMERAAERMKIKVARAPVEVGTFLRWITYSTQGSRLFENHLIPNVEVNSVSNRPFRCKRQKPLSAHQTLKELGKNLAELETPSQTMALLANEGGFLVLLCSERSIQRHFLDCLSATFDRVMLQQEMYSMEEKTLFLQKIGLLQDYFQMSITVVSSFLFQYLAVWDGHDFEDEIFSILEWYSFRSTEEWTQMCQYLRLLFRAADATWRSRMLNSLSRMIHNSLVSSVRVRQDGPLPLAEEETYTNVTSEVILELVCALVSEFLIDVMPCSKSLNTHVLRTAALEFYHSVADAEEIGDLAIMVLLPPVLVYSCLTSDSRYHIERLCSLLLKYDTLTQERLHRLGVFAEYEEIFNVNLSVYLLDCYRALFADVGALPDRPIGLFTEDLLEALKKRWNGKPQLAARVFRVDTHPAWWVTDKAGHIRQMSLSELSPAAVALKKLVEKIALSPLVV